MTDQTIAPAMENTTNQVVSQYANDGFSSDALPNSNPLQQNTTSEIPVPATPDVPKGPLVFEKYFQGVEELVKDDKLLGKYTNVGEFAKAYKELQTSYMKTQNDLKAAQEGKTNIPEAYEYEEVVKNAGLEFQDKEQFEGVLGQFKEKGFSQDQFNFVMDMAGQLATGLMANEGPRYDVAAERAVLEKEWGSDVQSKLDATFNFAKNVVGIPPDVWNNSLRYSAAGMKWVYQLSQKLGSNPTAVDTTPTASTVPSKGQIFEMMNDPRYKGSATDPSNAEYQARVREMISKAMTAGVNLL